MSDIQSVGITASTRLLPPAEHRRQLCHAARAAGGAADQCRARRADQRTHEERPAAPSRHQQQQAGREHGDVFAWKVGALAVGILEGLEGGSGVQVCYCKKVKPRS